MDLTDSINPYQPSQHPAESVDRPSAGRRAAMRRVRLAVALLFLPAFFNFQYLYGPSYYELTQSSSRDVFLLVVIFQLVIVLVAAGVFFLFGLWFCDWIAELLRRFFGRELTRQQWLESMYASSWPLPWAAFIGALVWGVWLQVFFALPGGNTPIISFAFGTIGHLLAASVYLNIFYGWYKLRRASSPP